MSHLNPFHSYVPSDVRAKTLPLHVVVVARDAPEACCPNVFVYGVNEVGNAVKSIYLLGTAQAGRVLESVGYAGNEIKKWGGSAINWIGNSTKKAAKTVAKAVKKIFKGW